jgi:hypothetical protein
MSEIKVNKISPRTACGTVTLGDSGDTFTIPSGATITNNGTAAGFGATGAASWDTTVKTASFTGVAGVGYFVNTTSGAITVTLPASPDAGAVIAVKDYANTFDTNNVTLARNGSNIGGDAIDATLSTEGLAVTLVYVDATQGWLVTDDGLQTSANTNPYIVATGGTITTCGNCKIHTFTGPGTFTVCQVAASAPNNQVSYMVVAGGGGAARDRGGGAGAGGFREDKSPITPYTASPLEGAGPITVTATAFPITVGGGGTGGPAPAGSPGCNGRGTNGFNSVFSTITSAGGGTSGPGDSPTAARNGAAGGSGGGGGAGNCAGGSPGAGNTPPVSPPQGNAGGNSSGSGTTANRVGGGGGGATVAGEGGVGVGPETGNGGAGATTSISGSPTAYAGGGGGGRPAGTAGTGGTGGGGTGSNGGSAGSDGTDNTGGGGGGGGNDTSSGGAGGSGIVIIRYKFQ